MKKRRVFVTIVLAMLILINLILMGTQQTNGQETKQKRYKYYTSISIKDGDSLWNIAKEYMSEEYSSIYEYIEELKRINNLEDNEIHAGNYLLVTYYSDVLK